MTMQSRVGSVLDRLLLGSIGVFIFIFVTVLISDIFGFIDIVSLNTPLEAPDFAAIASAGGSIILYFGLVILYREQALIQENQENWMEAEHTPDITVDKWEVNRNKLEFSISNLGAGIAKDMKVDISVEILTGDFGLEQISVECSEELWRDDIVSRVIEQQQMDPPRTFMAVPQFEIEWYQNDIARPKYLRTPNEAEGSFSEIIDLLYEEGVEVISYKIDVSYNYVTDRLSNSVTVWEGEAEIEEDMDFEGAVLETEAYDTGLGVEPNNWKDLSES